jgi:hypothetical protein
MNPSAHYLETKNVPTANACDEPLDENFSPKLACDQCDEPFSPPLACEEPFSPPSYIGSTWLPAVSQTGNNSSTCYADPWSWQYLPVVCRQEK